jgi:hypothetical protein
VSQARALLVGAGAVLVIGLILLVLAGASDRRGTAFSLDVPTGGPAAVLHTGQSTCATPIQAPQRFDAVTVWTTPAVPTAPPATARMQVHLAGGQTLSADLTPVAGESQFEYQAARAALPHPVAPGRLTVCVNWRGAGQLVLGGASAAQLAMVFDRPDPPSLLGALPTALRRAALFHPGWVGAWTFWALLGGLLAGLLLVLAATRRSL